MTVKFRLILPILMLSGTFALAGCDSPEEKAERYYQSGMELLAAGDADRAMIEFRNVFKYNGFHKEARRAYADLLLARGDVNEAYSQYLRLIEQYPDITEVRRTLAEIAIERGDWDEAERHGKAAIALTPDEPTVKALKVSLDYRDAALARDEAAKTKAVKAARAVLAEVPDSMVARSVVIDWALTGPEPQAALPDIEAALGVEPKSLTLNVQKFRLLAQAGDVAATGAQLRKMYELFPDNQEVQTTLIRWYLVQKDFDGAEAFLRTLAGEDTASPEGHVAVVQLLRQAHGPEAALAELDRLIAANAGQPNADLYGALRATITFEQGARAKAISALEAILKAAPASDQTRRIKIMLARMLATTGNQVGARARVEEVLTEDPGNIDALKIRGAWRIDEDKAGEAIIDLRAALDQKPRDAETLTLLAQANERNGNPELAGERLSQAVEVSGSAPEPTLRYVRFLLLQGRTSTVESLLVDALRINSDHVGLLSQLAGFYLGQGKWAQAQDVVARLGALNNPEAQKAVEPLQATLLLAQNRTTEGVAFLQSLVDDKGSNTAAVARVVQTQIRDGQIEAARKYVDDLLAKAPEDAGLRLIRASLHAVSGERAEAEIIYRALVGENPKAEAPVRLLYGVLLADGRKAEADAVLEAGLAAQPASDTLRLLKAAQVQQAGDIEGAITIYEALYAENSDSVLVANNLASLLTTFRDDPESLDRAYAIARRLTGTKVPAFQDTYGWIAYRRGNLDEALIYLEPAAAGLPQDALTQFHLGMTYVGLKRPQDAARVLKLALELAGDSKLPHFETARKTLAGLPE